MLFSLGLMLLYGLGGNGMPKEDLWTHIFQQQPGWFQDTCSQKERYQIQVRYTMIDRDENNLPHFKTYTFGVPESTYFYPASSIKYLAAVLSLEKLNQINNEVVTLDTPLKIGAEGDGQVSLENDHGKPLTVDRFMRQIFAVSDNNAFNRLYEFLGQETFNKRLNEIGLTQTTILHRLESQLTPEQNRNTNPFYFFNDNELVYSQPAVRNPGDLCSGRTPLFLGKAYIRNGMKVEEPMDFTCKNRCSLDNLQGGLMRLVFPNAFPEQSRFHLKQNQYDLLYRYLSMTAPQCPDPVYDSNVYPDGTSKLFFLGRKKGPMPAGVYSLNKTGEAYGFLIDNAYIFSPENSVEFFLSAVIYVNQNETFNDDDYEYEKTGNPFFAQLGKAVFDFECHRERNHKVDFSGMIAALKWP